MVNQLTLLTFDDGASLGWMEVSNRLWQMCVWAYDGCLLPRHFIMAKKNEGKNKKSDTKT